MRTYCVKQKKETLCIPGSEKTRIASNGRTMLVCKCAECGATKTQFVKVARGGAIGDDFACGYNLKGKRAGTAKECFKKGQVRYWGLKELPDDNDIDILLTDRKAERNRKARERRASKSKTKPMSAAKRKQYIDEIVADIKEETGRRTGIKKTPLAIMPPPIPKNKSLEFDLDKLDDTYKKRIQKRVEEQIKDKIISNIINSKEKVTLFGDDIEITRIKKDKYIIRDIEDENNEGEVFTKSEAMKHLRYLAKTESYLKKALKALIGEFLKTNPQEVKTMMIREYLKLRKKFVSEIKKRASLIAKMKKGPVNTKNKNPKATDDLLTPKITRTRKMSI